MVAEYQFLPDVRGIASRHGVTEKTVYDALRLAGISTGYFKTVNHDYFACVDTEEKAYWLGFLAADGCVTGQCVSLGLQRRDKAHLLAFRGAVGSTHKVCDIEDHRTRRFNRPTLAERPSLMSSFQFRSVKMVADLARVGITPRKSLVASAWPGPPHLLRHWLRGLIDGDGWVTLPRDGGVGGTRTYLSIGLVGSPDCVRAFAGYASRLTKSSASPRRKNQTGLWTVSFNGTVAQKILQDLYLNARISLERKRLRALHACLLKPRESTGARGPRPSSPMA